MNADEFDAFEKAYKWIFAKTYAHFCPHWYIVLDKIPDKEGFRDFVQFIDDNGVVMRWNKYTRKYYDHGEYRYWHMGTSDKLDEIFLINRELITGSKCKPIEK